MRHRLFLTSITILIFTFFFTAAAVIYLERDALAESADSLTVEDIVKKTSHVAYYQGNDGRAEVNMVITDNQDRVRKRRLIILRKDNEKEDKGLNLGTGGQKMYVYFKYPSDVNKMAFLVWKNDNKDDDRWLYLPALDLVKRIAASDERTSFAGSDFFYEDVSGRAIYEDTHELIETTSNYFVLQNTPIKPETVEFANYKMWIHKSTFIPVKIEYYNKQGNAYRRYEAEKVDTVDGFPTVSQSKMSDLRTGGHSVITYKKVRYNVGLPDNIFTERFLRNPPLQYIK